MEMPNRPRAQRVPVPGGVPFGVNTVLTRVSFSRLASTVRRAEELGAREVQLLRYKPAGRAASPAYLATRLSPEQVASLGPALEALGRSVKVALRIDCALVPLLSGHFGDAEKLARFGVLGCEAGRYLAAVRVDGALAPCSFAPAADVGVNEAWTEGGRAWEGDRTLAAYRAPHEVEPCRSCSLRAVCRGGCRVVASHLATALAPDPECPRVQAYRSRMRGEEVEGEAEG